MSIEFEEFDFRWIRNESKRSKWRLWWRRDAQFNLDLKKIKLIKKSKLKPLSFFKFLKVRLSPRNILSRFFISLKFTNIHTYK
jgi:hypothetical protein